MIDALRKVNVKLAGTLRVAYTQNEISKTFAAPGRACYLQGTHELTRGPGMFELFDQHSDVRIREGGSLPHWYQPGVSYFVTFRTEDFDPDRCQPTLARESRPLVLSQNGISPDDPPWRERLSELPAPVRRLT